MNYICHRRYKKEGASGKEHLIRRKTNLESIGKFIAIGAEAICSTTSADAFQYFARNDDGNGLERGRLTYEIAYAPRHPNKDNGFRFTEGEREMLVDEYRRFLRQDVDTIIFNFDFFIARSFSLTD